MKTQLITAHLMTYLTLLFVSFGIIAHGDNGIRLATDRSENATVIGEINAYRNPLLLNNQPLNYSTFSLASKGTLAVLSGGSGTTCSKRIPFRIYLKRNEQLINNGASVNNRAVSEIDIAPVLAMAKPGDVLVIEPTRKEDATARRTIRLIGYFDYFLKSHKDLFSFWPNKGNGC
ncbi:hypothetical protein [Spirosoma agri]|uniref:Uncharacterized protein n=1 Tax=Spirosoma agri TaxID=1987381 RepID=A0A6M0INU8_9BACT|nr:hypothetical protein [Spirosoma agri]NEU69245.1 hypothetical protein [Spirosoma agri]